MKLKLLTFIFFLLANFCFSQNNTLKDSLTKNNYKIQYPTTWRLDTSKVMGTEFFILSPLENETDKFSENINLLIQNLNGQNINLEKYKQITDEQLVNMGNDCKVFESLIVKKENQEYFKVTYTMIQMTLKLKITSICFIKNNKAYLVTLSAEFDKYEQYKKIGEDILNSFHFIN